MKLLTIALLIDAAANIARLIGVEIQYRRQARLIREEAANKDAEIARVSEFIADLINQKETPHA